MTDDDIIEGVTVPERALVVQQPGQAIVAADGPNGPEEMLAKATGIATALSRMVEAQRLYTTISGKKYPQVEAWMTIGRMDNVVAREASSPTHEDDVWTAEVELVRLSDGMVIGRASAMCGANGDRPWDTRPTHQRRSMAVTRATSRAFRQQYSWIMALAGYEPTPADEMPAGGGDAAPTTPTTTHADGLVGKAIVQGNQDGQLRQAPDGSWSLPFRVKDGRVSKICVAHGDIAQTMGAPGINWLGELVTVWGTFSDETYSKADETIRYAVLHVERIRSPYWTFPDDLAAAPDATSATETPAEAEPDTIPLFELDEAERAAIGGGLPE